MGQARLVESFSVASPATDSPRSFREVLADRRDGRLQIPEHQRAPDAWDDAKRKEYIARLRDSARGCHPPGSFATYQIVTNDNSPSATYLNDGYQRLTTLMSLQAEPSRFDMDDDGVRNLLEQLTSVQHRHYASHDEAMRDFQLINFGTRLTPYELCLGTLKYMKGYEDHWRRLFEEIEEAVHKSDVRLQTTIKRQRRSEEHKLRRHTFALFYRFITGEKRNCHYPDVPAGEIQRYIDKESTVEWRLRRVLLTQSYEDAKRNVKQFQGFINHETAELEDCVRRILAPGAALAPVTHRWLLDLAIWRRHNQIPRPLYAAFVEKLLQGTRGKGQWVRDSEDGKATTLNLCHLGLLPKLAERAGMPEFCEPRRRRKAPASPMLPGYDNSHYESFATHGDGPSIPEPAPTNRSRGPRPMNSPSSNTDSGNVS